MVCSNIKGAKNHETPIKKTLKSILSSIPFENILPNKSLLLLPALLLISISTPDDKPYPIIASVR